MENFKLTTEQAKEIEKQIKLNTFLDDYLQTREVGNFNVDSLLTESDYETEKNISKERDVFLSKFSIEQILEAFLKNSSFKIRPDGNVEIT